MKNIFKLFKNFQVVGKFSLNGPFILMFTRELGEGMGEGMAFKFCFGRGMLKGEL